MLFALLRRPDVHTELQHSLLTTLFCVYRVTPSPWLTVPAACDDVIEALVHLVLDEPSRQAAAEACAVLTVLVASKSQHTARLVV